MGTDKGEDLKRYWIHSFYFKHCREFGSDSVTTVHPDPLVMLHQKIARYFSVPCIELMPLHSEYISNLIIVAKWFSQTILTPVNKVSNDHACLALFGAHGAGKSRIVEAMSEAMNGTLWTSRSSFQSPNIVSSSVLTLSDIHFQDINNEQMKNVLDFAISTMVQAK